ncbi:alternate-type signal peptide domain-containing protein [Paenarthrobacter sp. YJN-5]|uniref:alternate-type signal peptide domain-containing protein n=1 Tax=Paenarthrobacter sp. YJN-5 TaxID=2735316 RepID=UPI001877B86E|nr:alternate-type signal peptide domain-containing protein [Paenarthrobacter sp. YJN-5]QOT16026.1 alternate-type signal peptide domain-containing protein [Paenarthrobacter sp. YJN-5]
MKNNTMLKGAAAIVLGGALLLGGGGTLAWWNAADSAAAGTISAGELNVKAGAGVWKDRSGSTVNLSTYKVVPGDKLTYTQDLDVTLTGDKMAANLVAVNADAGAGFTPENVVITAPTLTVGGVAIENPLTTSQHVTASISFEFKSTTTGTADVNATKNLGTVGFTLQQVTQTGLQ